MLQRNLEKDQNRSMKILKKSSETLASMRKMEMRKIIPKTSNRAPVPFTWVMPGKN
jgi:hypothetical protein